MRSGSSSRAVSWNDDCSSVASASPTSGPPGAEPAASAARMPSISSGPSVEPRRMPRNASACTSSPAKQAGSGCGDPAAPSSTRTKLCRSTRKPSAQPRPSAQSRASPRVVYGSAPWKSSRRNTRTARLRSVVVDPNVSVTRFSMPCEMSSSASDASASAATYPAASAATASSCHAKSASRGLLAPDDAAERGLLSLAPQAGGSRPSETSQTLCAPR
mmetsp:Transcript_24546/g.76954  ORF Transcript_24546/g.76954 Transcript_24546/m.76954 type:complete len:217 (+) Transcript_24546:2387-3037(+)